LDIVHAQIQLGEIQRRLEPGRHHFVLTIAPLDISGGRYWINMAMMSLGGKQTEVALRRTGRFHVNGPVNTGPTYYPTAKVIQGRTPLPESGANRSERVSFTS
jgi:hypothetical protein